MERVMHLISTDIFSGAENVACQIIKMFNKNKNYDMCYCATMGSNKEILLQKKINVIPLKNFDLKSVKKAIKEYQPTIIHAHDAKSCVMAVIGTRNKNIKIIAHIHGNHENMRKFTVKSFLFNIISKKFKKIIWVSKSSLENYYFSKNVKKKSIVLYNVIDSDELYQKMKFDNQIYPDYDLIFLGRLSYPKNPERLIDIIHEASKKMKNIKVAIVGTGELEKSLKEKVSNYKIEKNVDFYGFLSNPYKILASSKLMIMTSRYEGTPMCALEAMAFGKPIISTPTDGLKDIINNGVTGFLSGDNNVLVEKILYLLENPNKLQQMQSCVLVDSKKINDIKNYISTLNNIYN